MPPDAAKSGGWEMEVRAASDIAAGEELLLSYGERRFISDGPHIAHPALHSVQIEGCP